MRWIVAQEGSRRNYAVPVGFSRIGSLRLLYADIWCRQGRSFLKRGPSVARVLAGRYSAEIPPEQVVSFNSGGIVRKSVQHFRTGSRENLGHFWCDFGEWFGSRVGKHLRELELDGGEDVFFGYNTNCLETLETLRRRGVTTVVAQVDPGRVEEDLVLAEAERWPGWERAEGRMPRRYWDRLEAEWNAADLLGVNSEWSKEALVRQGVPVEKIFVVPLAIDLNKFAPGPERSVCGAGPLKVLWMGSVILRKGIQYLVEAARLLSNTEIQFLVAGEVGIAGPVVESFPGNLKMLGRVTRDRVNALYSEADVFVLPTISDGFAVTQLEAMAQGLPVVTTPNCGRVVTNGINGLVVPARDGQALADALARLDRDRNLLREMSRQARLTIRNFDLPANAVAISNAVLAHWRRSAEETQYSRAANSPAEITSTSPASLPIQTGHAPVKKSSADAPSETLPRAVVSFAGSRDRYQLAWALQGAGLLERLVTDLYLEPQVLPFGDKMSRSFPKLMARHSPGISRQKVLTPVGAMMDGLLMRTAFGTKERQIRLDRVLGQTARTLAWETQTALFSYSYYAATAFAPGACRPPMRFLFQLHPHPAVVRKILQAELVRNPRFAASLKWEHEIGDPEAHFQSLCQEAHLANGWVVASSYTAKTLEEQGISRNEIHVVPYGVDARDYPCRDFQPRAQDPFRVIWVGSMTQRKGLSYFLEAMGSLPQENLEVLICGHHAVDRPLIKEFGIRNVRVYQSLPTKELTDLLRSCDLFVLPSLVEGFGHVILEAMSSGVPVMATPSTCAPDVLKDGVQGFIIPVRDSAAIASRVSWGRQHRMELYWMGQAAAAQAKTFTWDRFRKGVVCAYAEMVAACRFRPETASHEGNHAHC